MLAPWIEPKSSDKAYRYDPTPREETEPASATRFTTGKDDDYRQKRKRIGIPIRVPSNG
jgi:hypothetical protein